MKLFPSFENKLGFWLTLSFWVPFELFMKLPHSLENHHKNCPLEIVCALAPSSRKTIKKTIHMAMAVGGRIHVRKLRPKHREAYPNITWKGSSGPGARALCETGAQAYIRGPAGPWRVLVPRLCLSPTSQPTQTTPYATDKRQKGAATTTSFGFRRRALRKVLRERQKWQAPWCATILHTGVASSSTLGLS